MSTLQRFRQPEYTGENRCIPCTLANSAIAVVLSAAVAAVWWPAAVAVLLVSALAIWLRGYLVPGTPELTKRYFPDWLLAYFDKGPEHSSGFAAMESEDGAAEFDAESFDAERVLLDGGVVEPCEDVEDLCLDGGFERAWYDRMEAVREDETTAREELARQLDVDPDSVTFEEYGSATVARIDGVRAGQWESHAALVADLAAAHELPRRIERWGSIPTEARSQLLGGLRIFLEDCPECGGPVLAGRETVESCCRSHEVVAASCDSCGARLLELPYEEVAA
ncbi:MAG: hypothetical protein V5A62_18630 [Haloarculaceae archaeon]